MNDQRRAFEPNVLALEPTDETTVEEAISAIEHMVFRVAGYIDYLEQAGKISEGHYAARRLAAAAGAEIKACWIEKDDV